MISVYRWHFEFRPIRSMQDWTRQISLRPWIPPLPSSSNRLGSSDGCRATLIQWVVLIKYEVKGVTLQSYRLWLPTQCSLFICFSALATKNAEEGAQTAIYLSASRAISKRNSGAFWRSDLQTWNMPIFFELSHECWCGDLKSSGCDKQRLSQKLTIKLFSYRWLLW